MTAARTVALLKSEEDWKATPYRDSKGYWTWGWGFLIDPSMRPELSREEGDFMLTYRENERRRELARRWPPFTTQPDDVQDALVCLAYQLGTQGVLGFHMMLDALARGDRETAALNALDSQWAKRDSPARAARMANLIRGHLEEADD